MLLIVLGQTCLSLGITPQEFIRWPLHPSQELHSCFGLRSTVCHNRGGQPVLTIRSASHLSRKTLFTGHTHTHTHTHKIFITWAGKLITSCLLCFVPCRRSWEVTHMITSASEHHVNAAALKPNTAWGRGRSICIRSHLRSSYWQKGSKVTRGDAEASLDVMSLFEENVWIMHFTH